jgi:hypothetical protein
MNIFAITTLLLQIEIDKKLENAPDDRYQIGIVIGTYLPFILLVIFAYVLYYRMKNRKDLED